MYFYTFPSVTGSRFLSRLLLLSLLLISSSGAFASLVQECNDADFDAASQTCAAPQWVDDWGVLPPLSITDSQSIGTAIVLCWVVGFTWRLLKRVVK